MESTHIGGLNVIYQVSSGAMLVTPSSEPKKAKPIIKEVEDLGGVAPWGTSNTFPQDVVAEIEKSDLIPSVLDKKAAMLHSGGLKYGLIDPKGMMKPLQVPEIEDFMHTSAIPWYLSDACNDHVTFYNIFARLRKNLKGDKIARLEVSDACITRLGLQNKSTGAIESAYLNYNWELGRTAKDKDTLKLACLDPYFDVAGQLRRSSAYDFIMPIRGQLRNRVYYEMAPWNGLRKHWLELAQLIPQFKKYLMQNRMAFTIVATIDQEFWPIKFGDEVWKKMSAQEQLDAQKEILDTITESAKGSEKAGGTLFLPKIWEELDGKGEYRELISIEVFDQKITGGEYNGDSQEIDFRICRALGVNPTLIGITPGKGHSAGSGSDQRVAHNNFMLDSKMDMFRILSPMGVISEFNGWNKKYGKGNRLTFWFDNYYTATLNSGASIQNNIEDANGDS